MHPVLVLYLHHFLGKWNSCMCVPTRATQICIQKAAEFNLITKCLQGAPERLDVERDSSPHLMHVAHGD